MYSNLAMNELLRKVSPQYTTNSIPELLEKKLAENGEDYYCIREGFCFPYIQNVTFSDTELSQYEWEGNEIFISDDSVKIVTAKVLKMIGYLQIQMRNEYPNTAFDIFVSMDIEEGLPFSATIRFYKVRNNFHIVTVEDLNEYNQPVMLLLIPEHTQ